MAKINWIFTKIAIFKSAFTRPRQPSMSDVRAITKQLDNLPTNRSCMGISTYYMKLLLKSGVGWAMDSMDTFVFIYLGLIPTGYFSEIMSTEYSQAVQWLKPIWTHRRKLHWVRLHLQVLDGFLPLWTTCWYIWSQENVHGDFVGIYTFHHYCSPDGNVPLARERGNQIKIEK